MDGMFALRQSFGTKLVGDTREYDKGFVGFGTVYDTVPREVVMTRRRRERQKQKLGLWKLCKTDRSE